MIMNLSELLDRMTPQERKEVETFAAFVLARRNLQKQHILYDDISSQELLQLTEQAGAFDWLRAEAEDTYSIEDGDEVQWPNALASVVN